MMKTRAREARPSIRTTEALSWGQAAKRHSRKADLRDLGCREGGPNPLALLDRGPLWAFVCKIEKLNTESPPHAVCSPMLPDRNLGAARRRLRGVGGLNLWRPWCCLPHWGSRTHFFRRRKRLDFSNNNQRKSNADQKSNGGPSGGGPGRARHREAHRVLRGRGRLKVGDLWAGTAWPCRINRREIPENFFLMQLVRAVGWSSQKLSRNSGWGG